MSRIAPTALNRFLDALLEAVGFLEHVVPTSGRTDVLLPDGGRREDSDDEHLRDVPDGAGCTEIWEHLSERQATEVEGDD